MIKAQWPRRTRFILLTLIAGLFIPETSYGYAGPGSIISGIGTLLAVVAAVAAAMLGFIWFPLKRLFLKLRSKDDEQDVSESQPPVM